MPKTNSRERDNLDLNLYFRNGGNLVEDRVSGGRDCVMQMRVVRVRPDVLASALRDMGVSASGDETPDNEC